MTSRERAHPWFALQGNIADSSELFIFGDDFDAILDILEEEELDEYFTEAADDVSIITSINYGHVNWMEITFLCEGKITREYTVISILVTYHVNQAKKQLTTAACRM